MIATLLLSCCCWCYCFHDCRLLLLSVSLLQLLSWSFALLAWSGKCFSLSFCCFCQLCLPQHWRHNQQQHTSTINSIRITQNKNTSQRSCKSHASWRSHNGHKTTPPKKEQKHILNHPPLVTTWLSLDKAPSKKLVASKDRSVRISWTVLKKYIYIYPPVQWHACHRRDPRVPSALPRTSSSWM